MLRNPPFCSFFLFLIVLLTPFINKRNFSSYLTALMSFISLCENINVFISDNKFYSWIPVSITDAAAVIPNGNKTFLVHFSLMMNQLSLMHQENWVILLIMFPVLHFNKVPLFSMDLITIIISCLIIYWHYSWTYFWLRLLSPAFTRKFWGSLLDLGRALFSNSSANKSRIIICNL